MQKEYLFLGDESINNDNYLLAVFKIIPADGQDLTSVATEIAAESSTGSNLKVGTATNYSLNINARVYEVNEETGIVKIAYPWVMFDQGGNVQNILTFIAGNIFGVSDIKGCKLLDVYFPTTMLSKYDGPSYTLDDMREYLNLWDSPVLGTIIKPKIGLNATEYAELCYDFWAGGGHFVKNDEPQADQYFCPYEVMVEAVKKAMDKAEKETGQNKVHSFNVSAADLDTMIERCELVFNTMKPGSYAFLVDGITAGWTAVQTIRRRYPNVFLHFHRAGHGAFTREENPIGYSVEVLTKMARLAGASGIHTGTAGVGKMAGDEETDINAANLGLRIKSKGPYFTQIWSHISPEDQDMKDMIEKEESYIENSFNNRSWQSGSMYEDSWRVVKKMTPIISGGLNPVLLHDFLEKMKGIDFITTMGAGVHSHPMGTRAGATAIVQSYEAWKERIPLEEYAKGREELKLAIEFYNKYGTQAKRESA
jgi:ribulose-bisphosphate carboxylase large chain